MRHAAHIPALLALSLLGASVSCQVISGLNDYEFVDSIDAGAGSGGIAAGGSAGKAASGGVGATTSGGGAGGSSGAGASGSGGTVDGGGGTGGAGDCTNGYSCVETVTPPWNGPVAVYLGASPPSCAGKFATQAYLGHKDISFATGTCSTCGCTSQCTASTKTWQSNTYQVWACVECNSGTKPCGSGTNTTLPAGACVPFGPGGQAERGIGPTFGTAGACTPTGGAPTLSLVTWKTTVVACAATAQNGTCPTDSVCIADIPAPFSGKPCVYAPGDLGCPVGPYTEKTLAYGSFDDSRGCEMCTCGGPTACGGTILQSNDATCTQTSTLKSVPSSDSCNDFQAKALQYVATGGDCAPAGGTAMGTVTPQEPTTICCLP